MEDWPCAPAEDVLHPFLIADFNSTVPGHALLCSLITALLFPSQTLCFPRIPNTYFHSFLYSDLSVHFCASLFTRTPPCTSSPSAFIASFVAFVHHLPSVFFYLVFPRYSVLLCVKDTKAYGGYDSCTLTRVAQAVRLIKRCLKIGHIRR